MDTLCLDECMADLLLDGLLGPAFLADRGSALSSRLGFFSSRVTFCILHTMDYVAFG